MKLYALQARTPSAIPERALGWRAACGESGLADWWLFISVPCNSLQLHHTSTYIYFQLHQAHVIYCLFTLVYLCRYVFPVSVLCLCVQGSAVIIPSYDKDLSAVQVKPMDNDGLPIRYLISAPTMRVPEDVSDTVNAYLAFRAVLRCGA